MSKFTVFSDDTIVQSFDADRALLATVKNPTKAERAAFIKAAPDSAVRIVATRNRYVSSRKAGFMTSYSGTVLNTTTYVRNAAGVWYADTKTEKRMFY